VTQVVVDEDDPAFNNPSKFVGPTYDYETAMQIQAEKGWVFKEDKGRGYRRVVPSPMPRRIVELSSIRALMEEGIVPITVVAVVFLLWSMTELCAEWKLSLIRI